MSSGSAAVHRDVAPWVPVASGATAGVVARFIVAPLDVVKIRLQTQLHQAGTAPKYTSMAQCFRMIAREEGILALWKGNLPALYLYAAYAGLQFSLVEPINTFTTSLLGSLSGRGTNSTDLQQGRSSSSSLSKTSPVISAVSGFLAASTAGTLTYPLDLLRTRWALQAGQVQSYSLASYSPTALIGSLADIARTEGGPRALYRGLSSALIGTAPAAGVSFGCYSAVRQVLDALGRFLTTSPHGPGGWRDTLNTAGVWSLAEGVGLPAAVSGATAGVASKLVSAPFDLIRKRLQIVTAAASAGTSTMATSIPAAAGPSAAFAARIMYEGSAVQEVPRTMWACARMTVRQEGMRGLFRGLTPTLVKAVPASAITFYVYELAFKTFSGLG
ncbi:hypothetical protein H696_01055 [Fonticula alba]|uniref:Mitochondrial thiamine pyrophosphate carrier 1 n=1 Tax=Fonticula alba TaxID=691883 RepID=A0A058ZCH8_FONAL|nr:hypothetical protein H696_01055 [Fonticula alba]KCV71638.1 hypothetical protein H696_01055 [Fonticula alba]|eukprot:XP_009493216.1 hypothetical protein H696_01055 [Fonticula alba]